MLRARMLVLAAVFLCASAIAYAAPTFPTLTGRVVDQAGILSPQAEAQLTRKLEELENTTGRQLVVVTLSGLQGYEIEEYGYQLGRAWGIGREKEDDGALLIVAPNDRKVRVEVGYGLEPVLTDALSSVILQERVLPRFRAGDLEGGVVSGTDALIEQLALPADEAQRRVANASRKARPGPESIIPLLVTLFIVFMIMSSLFGSFRRRRLGGVWPAPIIIYPGSRRGDGGGFGGWGGGGGFGGGGGSFGGGGASGSW
jgi:uncharacterized protein